MRGGSDLATAQFAPRLGRSLAEAAAEPRGLLHDRFTLCAAHAWVSGCCSSAYAADQDADAISSAASTLAPGGPARRELPPVPQAKGSTCGSGSPKNAAHVQAILDHAERTAGSVEQLLAADRRTRPATWTTRAGGRFSINWPIGYYRTGHWPLAAETFQVLAERYPQHPLTPQAMLWLVQYYASGEAAWRVEHGDAGKSDSSGPSRWAKQIERTRPEWFAEPALCFPLAAAYRGLGQAVRPSGSTSFRATAAIATPGRPARRASCTWPMPQAKAGRPSRRWSA